MDANFWKNRWLDNETGWQQDKYNAALLKHWPKLPKRSRVLVPLCGKSLDLIYLAEQGLQVFGFELSEKAVEDFFIENGLNYHSHFQGEYQHFQCVELSIHFLVGDFFAVTADDLPFDVESKGFDALYDRAAYVALPPEMRKDYVAKCLSLLKADYQGLLQTVEHQHTEKVGPPFSITDEEVMESYSGRFVKDNTFDLLAAESRFVELGYEVFNELTWLISDK